LRREVTFTLRALAHANREFNAAPRNAWGDDSAQWR
jgi:hypothetical protein